MKLKIKYLLPVSGAIAACCICPVTAQTTYTYSGGQNAMNQAQAPIATYDTVEWNITGGYFGTSSARSQTYTNPNLIFTSVAMNNGWGEAVTRFSSATTVTGTGPFSLTTAGLGQDFVFAGNMQGYGGNVSITDSGGNNLTLGNTGSSIVQYGGESAGGNQALGSITSDGTGNWINNVAGSGSISVNNVVFNYATDASYDYVNVTNAITQRDSVNFIGNANVLASGAIAGAGALNKSGSGTLTLTGGNSYSGATSVTDGILNVGTGGTTGNLGSGAISVGSGAEIVFNRSNAFTVSNTISGAGLLTKKGGGRMSVSGNNSGGALNWNFTGTGNGDIGFQNANALGGAGSAITLADSATGSTFFASSGNNSGVDISIGSGANFTWNGSTGNTNTLSGVISGSGTFTKVSGENLILTGANTFTGPISISGGGTLQIGGSGVLGGGNHAGSINNANRLFINSTSDQTLAGAISGGGSLDKSNSGMLILSGSNTYSGATTVSAGTLLVTGALGSTNVTVQSTATIGGSGTLGGSLTLQTGSALDLSGASLGLTSSNILTVSGAIALSDFGFANLTGWDASLAEAGTYTLINGGSAVTLSGTTPTSSNPYDFGNGKQGYFQEGSLQVVIIPEPRAALLGGIGMLLLLRRRRLA